MLLADIRYAIRGFLKSPLFTIVAVASLALGLGANAAIFNLLDQVLFKALPVKAPAQLVMLDSPGAAQGSFEGDSFTRIFSYPLYTEVRDRNHVFAGVMARYPTRVNFGHQGQTESVRAELVTGNYFEVLGVLPAEGRLFSQQDDIHKGQHPVAVLSHGFWMRRFGGDPHIVGQAVRINGTLMTVIGVAPREFFGVSSGSITELYVPMMMKAEVTPTWDRLEDRMMHFVHIMARLKPGVTPAAAAAELRVLYPPILESDIAAMGMPSEKLKERFRKKELLALPAAGGIPILQEMFQAPLVILMSMVGLVLLIACANVANLLVARSLGRQKEIAVRLSLGARRVDVVRQLLVESLLLSLAGAAAGLMLAAWTSDIIVRNLPGDGGTSALAGVLDPRTILFGLAIAILTGIAFGVLPAVQATRPDLTAALKAHAGGVVGGFKQIRSRQALVVAQVALSLLLLAGAGLFTRTLVNLRHLDPGFRTENLVLFSMDAARNGYPQPRVHQLYQSIVEKLGATPGVTGAALTDIVPLAGDQNVHGIKVEGYTPKPDESDHPFFAGISPGYFRTMQTPLLAGRDFTTEDRWEAGVTPRKVAIVNQTFARFFFGNESPIGRRFRIGDGTAFDIEIVGVARDGKYDSLRHDQAQVVYLPCQQNDKLGAIAAMVRTSGPPEAAMPGLRRALAEVDPNLAMWDLTTMEAQVNEQLFGERLIAILCACFGALATVLASIGLYGVTAYSVARRTREIGIRVALGASRPAVLKLVLKEVAWLCLGGLGIGVPLTLALGRFIQTELYGVTGHDAVTLSLAVLALMTVSFAAGFLPARRAAGVDPTVALRYD